MKPTRLVVSIYLVALVQLLTAWIGFSVSRDYLAEPPGRLGRGGWETFAATHVAFDRKNPDALRETMEWLQVELGIHVTLFSPDGQRLASTHAEPPAPLSRAAVASLPVRDFVPAPKDMLAVGIHEAGELVAYVITDRFQFRRPFTNQVIVAIAMLSVVFAGSMVFARSIARPLRRLARVARDFGGGQLDARVRLARRDELGAVATAFDDMADRITALLQSQRELLANVSHELRTPLARIRVALDLAVDGDAEAAREALAEISTDWGDLERLVEDILAAARLDLGSSAPGGLVLRKDEVDLISLAEAAQRRYQLAFPNQTLTLELSDDVPVIEGDAGLLRRVIDNLVDNSRKYSEPSSPVELHVRGTDEGAMLTVVDHGMGIEAADLPHIFAPFFRADRSRARQTGGVGLGLALVRSIVRAHGGEITVKSQVGVGTQAEVRLPRRIVPAAARSGAPGKTTAPEHSHTSSADVMDSAVP